MILAIIFLKAFKTLYICMKANWQVQWFLQRKYMYTQEHAGVLYIFI